ncbi:TPA: 16S rRNA (cytidine(1402)-2'-O)-methyltransferase [Patescibacteria group bacterium]|uniref:Ribosomal RNA small subunit methyltransferase I n=2 Tax=Bacteria division Kazan-3B-28 TaxID=1798534 RepID=A0A0G1X7N3_UNCK3|nr:MAG: methyltransferase, 16S rRNA (cytidine1402-2'-O)-methyltransferase [candidate division Kazan bacterium GW2011_GWA1_50_15]KKW25802.1 MAG: Ribosomal RNA small subunit methyltransferase I [candidate division Kazan bacterium GW2011_GWC1_52_13]KKW27183.1 MAG: Ribosomal RNA small subunit methyltransferase I [candidate division Kazan bacterium GW2011_GWB1_52_7]HCL47557.1 16S rRNA (cytidine(1402)-2'-O)-methyltransferase [Patescibacteria group bacterium]HCR42473.1 16S rRNA (cytidine(1402)-2'-O)-m
MLFVVATPIGNLQDISLRALETLRDVDVIAAEDTRQTKKLLDRHNIKTSLISFHQHTRSPKTEQLVAQLVAGKRIALVTDAGTPGIADPGSVLVQAARQAGVKVVPIPGASAVTTLLSAAGISADSFLFLGFLPKKKGRASLWQEMKTVAVPIVLFESPNRVVKTLNEIRAALGEREVIIGRELTKLHEEILRLPVSIAIEQFSQQNPKGEFVIVIS